MDYSCFGAGCYVKLWSAQCLQASFYVALSSFGLGVSLFFSLDLLLYVGSLQNFCFSLE